MKNLILFLLVVLTLFSCKEIESPFPKYTLHTVNHIPDSLRTEHREWIKETVRAASQHMTGGDYEDADDTIRQAENTANRIFGTEQIGLRKEIDDNYWNDLYLTYDKMTDYEKKVLDSLKNVR